jgi:hypothetical protein
MSLSSFKSDIVRDAAENGRKSGAVDALNFDRAVPEHLARALVTVCDRHNEDLQAVLDEARKQKGWSD